MRRARVLVLSAVLVAAAGAAFATVRNGRIGPRTRIQPSGRLLQPYGRLTHLGNLPAGGALTPSGRFLWAASAGRGRNDVRIVRVLPRRGHRRRRGVGRVVQVIPMPGTSGGIAMARDGRTAYVSGTPEAGADCGGDQSCLTTHKSEQSPPGTPGKQGDVIHVFRYSARRGRARRTGLIAVPPPSDAPVPQSFPPTNTKRQSWPRDLAVSRDGKTLLVALNLADYAAIVDTAARKVRAYVKVGHYPYGAAITRDGKLGLVSNETDGTVSVIDLASARKLKDIQVGPHLSHPEGIAIDPRARRAYVALANQDIVAVIDTKRLRVARTLSVEEPQGLGASPVSLSVTPDGCRLLVADSGEDAIAVFALRRRCGRSRARPWRLVGRIPVASYPVFAAETRRGRRLAWVSAKGLGAGPNQIKAGQTPPPDDPGSATSRADPRYRFHYLPSHTFGMSGIARFPTNRAIRRMTRRARRQIRPSNPQRPPAGTPLDPKAGKLKYVFYFVRENRTYDQVLGDDSRGDGDPNLTLFGSQITPNLHALVQRFPLLDHVYANSEASIDGHFWTSAGAVSDYVVKNWHQNYGGRERPYDFGVYEVTWPGPGFLFDAAQKQGISWFNYGEAVAGVVPTGVPIPGLAVPLTDKDRTPAEEQQVAAKLAKSDIGPGTGCYPNDASIGTEVLSGGRVDTWDSSPPPGATGESRFDCFRQKFAQQLAQGSVPAFNYLVLPSDHTQGTASGRRTPRAMIAENDYALGQFVDLISHSSIWDKSVILVVEDDSQDGADHVDAHRIPALVISPYAKRGAVIHDRYDFLSFIRTLELVVGMKPLNLFDSLGVPLYHAFASSASNAAPYDAIQPNVNINERNSASAAGARLSAKLNLSQPDRVPQRTLDAILWRSVHGASSTPPPPGPNASPEDDR